jgi:hypothetical protein
VETNYTFDRQTHGLLSYAFGGCENDQSSPLFAGEKVAEASLNVNIETHGIDG